MRTGCMFDTAVGAWARLWWHCGGHHVTDSLFNTVEQTVPSFGISSRCGYERLIDYIQGPLQAVPFLERPRILVSCPHLHVPTTAFTCLLTSSIWLAMSPLNWALALTVEVSWLNGTPLSGLHSHVHFKTGYAPPVQSGGSVSSVVLRCPLLHLPS